MKKIILGMVGLALYATTMVAENIYPISREMGSGTRGAFVEIFGVHREVKGKKIDATSKSAEVTNSTGVMITSVSNSKNSIGYISLGSLNDKVKSVNIDGKAPSVENIQNKSYVISRPFHIVTKGDRSPLLSDFISYILSTDAKAVVEKAGYISNASAPYTGNKPSGKVVIAGSSSVTPLMEKLKESYVKINPNAIIEIQQSDSTTGVNSVVEGIADLGMVSREIKDSESKKGISYEVLAIDGLAIIVNKENPISYLSKEQVRDIFLGNITTWDKVK